MDAHELMLKSITELLTLSCIREDASFSYYVSKRIKARTEGAIHIPSGYIIPYLYNLQENEEIRETARVINGKIRDCYEITPAGEKRLAELTDAYMDTHRALLLFLEHQQKAQQEKAAQGSD